MNLPAEFKWLEKEGAPRMLVEALKLYGTQEKAGEANNPVILEWADELGLKDYNADSIPWCGLFMAYVAHKADKQAPASPLWARSWASFGSPCTPELGCVLVFSRDGGGHVGLYICEDDKHFYVLGGNQKDQVCIVPIEKSRMVASRAFYNKKPDNVRQIVKSIGGRVSTNER